MQPILDSLYQRVPDIVGEHMHIAVYAKWESPDSGRSTEHNGGCDCRLSTRHRPEGYFDQKRKWLGLCTSTDPMKLIPARVVNERGSFVFVLFHFPFATLLLAPPLTLFSEGFDSRGTRSKTDWIYAL